MVLSYEQIVKDLEIGKYYPVYCFYGEEAFFIDELSDYISQNIIPDSEKDFNQYILYGDSTTIKDVMIRAVNFPMMGNFQLIIVKEAQQLGNFPVFEKYFLQLQKRSIVVFCFKNTKSIDKRIKATKLIDQFGVLFESKKKYDNEVPAWIEEQFRKSGFSIHPPAIRLLFEHVGNNLSQLNIEIKKLLVAIEVGQKNITEDDISKNVGINRSFNVFELQKALGAKNRPLCYKIIDYFGRNPKENPLVVITANLYSYFCKILMFKFLKGSDADKAKELGVHPFFIKEYSNASVNYKTEKIIAIYSYLKEADLRLKGVEDSGNISEADILKELIFKILN